MFLGDPDPPLGESQGYRSPDSGCAETSSPRLTLVHNNGPRAFAICVSNRSVQHYECEGQRISRKVKTVARRKKLTYRWVPERGSGSRGTVYVGSKFTVVKDLKKELGPGLLSDMLKQIGIRKEDL